MELKTHIYADNSAVARLLHWVNLRPEESERTLMMFAFYTTFSVGLRWVEDSTVALFLDKYDAKSLPLIYIASAAIGAGLVFFYSWLQKIFPLRWVIVAIAPCMVAPLFLLLWGMQVSYLQVIAVFMLRLWVDALYVVNDLNTSITANQLFNIREIKRTYPLVSSGILVADVFSGFSLPWLLQFVRLENIILIGAVVIVLGAGILLYLSSNYRQAFPNLPQRQIKEVQTYHRRRLSSPLKRYALQLFAFIGLLQVIGLLIDFQYLSQLQSNFEGKEIASFLGLFGATVGLCELVMQWFISSRVIERLGVFVTAGTLPLFVAFSLPLTIFVLSLFPANGSYKFFYALIILKFIDELLRYTFVASSGPLLFQPIPETIRSYVQTLSGGIAEAIATGLTGLIILASLRLRSVLPLHLQNWVLVITTTLIALLCVRVLWIVRSRYVDLLVLSAERGQLSATDIDLRVFKQAVVKALGEKGTPADKRSCIEVLAQIDPQGAAEVLAPLLIKLPIALQCQSLEVMLACGANPAYLPQVKAVLEQNTAIAPEVFALALRYVWLTQANPNLSELEEYLHPAQNAPIRGTAAALLLRQGTPMQKLAATKTLRRMLTHKLELERVNAVKALREAVYLQALRVYIPNLLQDQSLSVRCAVLEMIAATHLEEYYSALLAGLYYKSTRNTAMRALARLENEALPMLVKLATDYYKPEVVRMYAWRTITEIGTQEATDNLWLYLETSWGKNRDRILRTLLKIHKQAGIVGLIDRLHQNRVETLIKQELRFLGELYAACIDLQTHKKHLEHQSNQKIVVVLSLLERALLELEIDIKERLLLLLKLLYPGEKIQAAAFHLRSHSPVNLARGLEILEYTVTLPIKSVLLNTLDRRSQPEKLQKLVEAHVVEYQQMVVNERIRRLLVLGNLLSEWCLACCFHFAEVARIRLPIPEILACLRHPTSFVREAAIAYLSAVSPRILLEILPQLQNDPHPLVAAQVKKLTKFVDS